MKVMNMELVVARFNTGSDDQSNYRKMHVACGKSPAMHAWDVVGLAFLPRF